MPPTNLPTYTYGYVTKLCFSTFHNDNQAETCSLGLLCTPCTNAQQRPSSTNGPCGTAQWVCTGQPQTVHSRTCSPSCHSHAQECTGKQTFAEYRYQCKHGFCVFWCP